jgi:hypothetical protein
MPKRLSITDINTAIENAVQTLLPMLHNED